MGMCRRWTGSIRPSRATIPIGTRSTRSYRFERVEGDVEVCFFITRGGRPYNIAVRRSDHRLFERVARDAVKNSWFEAIPRPDKVPQVKTCRTFMFRLEPLEPDDITADTGSAT